LAQTGVVCVLFLCSVALGSLLYYRGGCDLIKEKNGFVMRDIFLGRK